MIIGIDAGGTNTDGVLLSHGKVLSSCKLPTTPNSVRGIKKVLMSLHEAAEHTSEEIDRVVIGTTLIINAAVGGKMKDTGCLLLPGPGLSPTLAKKGEVNEVVDGYIDHRGRNVEPLDEGAVRKFKEKAKRKVDTYAVVGKFSIRNPELEEQAIQILNGKPSSMGYEVANQLGFPTRASTTVLNAKSKPIFHHFTRGITAVLEEIGIEAPVFFIKSDGAMLNVETASQVPAMTIKSGPAVSTLGLFALTGIEHGLAVDIGGTTTDLGIITRGHPKITEELEVCGFQTFFASIDSTDLPLGGDSLVVEEDGKVTIQPERRDRAAAFGGGFPTPTDALHVLDDCTAGDTQRAKNAIKELSKENDLSTREVARSIVQELTQRICKQIRQFIKAHEELDQETTLIGGGFLSQYLLPKIAEQLDTDYIVPPYAEVAGAVGCAVSRVSLKTSIHMDSARGTMVVNGEKQTIERGKQFSHDELAEIAKTETTHISKAAGASTLSDQDIEIKNMRYFNVVEHRRVQGQICDMTAQVRPGISPKINVKKLRDKDAVSA